MTDTGATHQRALRVSPALAVGALLSWVPVVSVVLVRVLWRDLPDRVPMHWSGVGIDQWGSTTMMFWSLLVPGLLGALACSILVVPLSSDAGRVGAAATVGIITAATGAIAVLWLAALFTAAQVPTPFLVVPLAIAWGALVFAVCLLRRQPPESPSR